jgi:hypothetical protein
MTPKMPVGRGMGPTIHVPFGSPGIGGPVCRNIASSVYCNPLTTHTCALFLTSPRAVNMRGFPAPLIMCRCSYLAVIMPHHFDTCILLITHPGSGTISAAGSIEIKIHALLCMPFPLTSDSSCVRVAIREILEATGCTSSISLVDD